MAVLFHAIVDIEGIEEAYIPAEWKRPRTGFLKTVKQGPKVALLGGWD